MPQILTVRISTEDLKIFANVFDSVDRNVMIHLLHNYSIPDEIDN